jgi:protein subunit release factor B
MPFPVDLKPGLVAKATALGIRPEDIEETFTRGSGSGGQKVNKTSSVAVLLHRPTGTVVRCQENREQILNRLAAYRILILKLEEQKLGKQSTLQKKIFKLRKQKMRRNRRSKEKMLAAKHHRSDIKEQRKPLA